MDKYYGTSGEYFIHRGYMIKCKNYYKLHDIGKSKEVIFLDSGISVAETKTKRDREILDWKRSWPKIHDVKELMEFILTYHETDEWRMVSEEEAEKIREGLKGCKKMREAIDMFPEVYRPFLLDKLRQDIRLKKMNITCSDIIEEDVIKRDDEKYNPDRFIEPEE